MSNVEKGRNVLDVVELLDELGKRFRHGSIKIDCGWKDGHPHNIGFEVGLSDCRSKWVYLSHVFTVYELWSCSLPAVEYIGDAIEFAIRQKVGDRAADFAQEQ